MSTPESAHARVYNAIKRGLLVRAEDCELCGKTTKTFGHHWRGYDRPLAVWWVCPGCNHKLQGRHDGSLTKNEARFYVIHRVKDRAELDRKNKHFWDEIRRSEPAVYQSIMEGIDRMKK